MVAEATHAGVRDRAVTEQRFRVESIPQPYHPRGLTVTWFNRGGQSTFDQPDRFP
jgi:hypothetical protein